ncbi:Cohesin subunit SA-1 [Nymphon striatum]|nr:Cohesin subunit SA-1 [Nymphon striatum]
MSNEHRLADVSNHTNQNKNDEDRRMSIFLNLKMMAPRKRGRPANVADVGELDRSIDTDDMFPMDGESLDETPEWRPTAPAVPVKRGRGRPKGSGLGPRGPRGPRGAKGRGTGHSGVTGYTSSVGGSSAEDANSLYEIVKMGKISLQVVVDDWIESYKTDKDAALLDLMQFFIQCSGCRGKITAQMQATMEHAQIIRQMTEQFDEDSSDYPLTMSGPLWKKFRLNFCEFVQVLVRQCQYSIIYDQYLMDNVISLLTGLSDSQVRAFRHTSTLAAMKLMTALVNVALNLSINFDNTQRQYESERQKNRDKRASERLEMLMTKRQELEENTEEIKNMLQYMFKSVFVHRYRDTLPEIRSICLTEIGVWMLKFHQMFLDDSYLKYIGWTLHDKVGDVRLKCLQALLPLYASDNLTSKLELFTNKFKDRIVAMTLDKEYDVAVQAVKLVISILKNHREILTDKDCEHIYELVYSSHRAVAQAAGEFLNERLFMPNEDQIFKSKRGKKLSANTPLVRDLVQFFIESELHEHGAYLTDSLIESNEMMKDWECMTDLLLEELTQEDEPLDNRQQTSLIEIMVCCVKQAATGETPVGRGPNRRQLSAKELKQIQDDKVKLTEHFIVTLPPLLSKYIADNEKIANLMIIPQYMELEIYTTSRQEKNLDALLALISEIVEKHTDTDVLEACSKTYEALCMEELVIHSRCAVARGTLVDKLVNKYKDALEEYNQLGEEVDVDEIFAVKSSLKKISIFYSCHNLGPWGIWDGLYDTWVKAAKDNPDHSPPEEIIKHAISSCQIGICWELHVLDEHLYTERVNNLKKRLHDFMQTMQSLLSHPYASIQELAFLIICDMLIIFCNQLEGSQLHELVFEPTKPLRNDLLQFIQNKVFIEEEESDDQDEHMKIEELHKRRSFLASFCKLTVYNVLSVRHASEVFKHFVKFYNDYGDIIKATLSKAREINKVNTARTMVISLTSLFTDLKTELAKSGVTQVDRQSDDFLTIKELAKRFALSFGLDPIRNREAVTGLHRMGIGYSCGLPENPNLNPHGPPANIAFLEILSEFTNKLVKQDKRVILQFLDQRISLSAMPTSSRSEDWQPLSTYRNSLVHGEQEQGPIKVPSRQYRGKRKREDDVIPAVHDDSNHGTSEHGSENDFDQGHREFYSQSHPQRGKISLVDKTNVDAGIQKSMYQKCMLNKFSFKIGVPLFYGTNDNQPAVIEISGIEPLNKNNRSNRKRKRMPSKTSRAKKRRLPLRKEKFVPKVSTRSRMKERVETLSSEEPIIEEFDTSNIESSKSVNRASLQRCTALKDSVPEPRISTQSSTATRHLTKVAKKSRVKENMDYESSVESPIGEFDSPYVESPETVNKSTHNQNIVQLEDSLPKLRISTRSSRTRKDTPKVSSRSKNRRTIESENSEESPISELDPLYVESPQTRNKSSHNQNIVQLEDSLPNLKISTRSSRTRKDTPKVSSRSKNRRTIESENSEESPIGEFDSPYVESLQTRNKSSHDQNIVQLEDSLPKLKISTRSSRTRKDTPKVSSRSTNRRTIESENSEESPIGEFDSPYVESLQTRNKSSHNQNIVQLEDSLPKPRISTQSSRTRKDTPKVSSRSTNRRTIESENSEEPPIRELEPLQTRNKSSHTRRHVQMKDSLPAQKLSIPSRSTRCYVPTKEISHGDATNKEHEKIDRSKKESESESMDTDSDMPVSDKQDVLASDRSSVNSDMGKSSISCKAVGLNSDIDIQDLPPSNRSVNSNMPKSSISACLPIQPSNQEYQGSSSSSSPVSLL